MYDGDTITVVFFLNGKPFNFRVRLGHIDTAEKTEQAIERQGSLLAGVNVGIGKPCCEKHKQHDQHFPQ